MTDDIREDGKMDESDHLREIVEAFSFSGMQIILYGHLTGNEDTDAVIVRMIREAATNALRHALNNALTQHIADKWKYKIYISPLTQLNIDNHNRIPTTDLRMLRRIVRDNKYRGHSASETILEWPKVRRGEDRNIFPYNAEADEFFNSVHIYELGVLRKYAEPLLRAVGPEEIGYGEAQRLLKLLEFFDVVQDDYLIVNNSILREFIGGSIYVE